MCRGSGSHPISPTKTDTCLGCGKSFSVVKGQLMAHTIKGETSALISQAFLEILRM